MTSINSITTTSPAQKLAATPIQKQLPTEQTSSSRTDRVELSGVSELLKTLKAGGDFRADKVAEIKTQIAAGTYETDDKFDAAADKLLDELNR
jgi:flagellar biosynthesis anti-sigma factor FlgM